MMQYYNIIHVTLYHSYSVQYEILLLGNKFRKSLIVKQTQGRSQRSLKFLKVFEFVFSSLKSLGENR